MWICKLKLRHDDCPIVTRCERFGLVVLSYPSTWYEEKGKRYATTICFFQGGDEGEKKKFLLDLKRDKRISRLERSGDIFTYEIALEREGEHVMLYHTRKIVFVKPTANHPDGHEYWEVAAWERKEVEGFIAQLREHMDVCKILRLEDSPLSNVYFPNLMPALSVGQRRALTLALERGYYSYPRKTTLERLAKLAKVGVSTFQEHLRRAEMKLVPIAVEPRPRTTRK